MEDFRKKLKEMLFERRRKDEAILAQAAAWTSGEQNRQLVSLMDAQMQQVEQERHLATLQQQRSQVTAECRQLESECAKIQMKKDKVIDKHAKMIKALEAALQKTQDKLNKYQTATTAIQKYMGLKVGKVSGSEDTSKCVVSLTQVDPDDPERVFLIVVEQRPDGTFSVVSTRPRLSGGLHEERSLAETGRMGECVRAIRSRFVSSVRERHDMLQRVLATHADNNQQQDGAGDRHGEVNDPAIKHNTRHRSASEEDENARPQ